MTMLVKDNGSAHVSPLRQETLDDLWREAETLGFVRVWTHTDISDRARRGYQVTIFGMRRRTKLEVKCEHTSLLCAFGDAINEAREMGLGEPG